MPGLTVVLPIQGYRTHSLLNWQSQLSMQYAGPLEYLFITQSASGILNTAEYLLIRHDAPVQDVFVTHPVVGSHDKEGSGNGGKVQKDTSLFIVYHYHYYFPKAC